jgi:Cof subfamily protein (haloacid dehalogenase superfamily)
VGPNVDVRGDRINIPPVRKLLALDLDGTLVKDDGTIAREDREAIANARANGVAVTIATGRIASGALYIARELELDVPLICSDGAQLVDPLTGALISHASVDDRARAMALGVFEARDLAPFALNHEAAHGFRQGERYVPYVRGFTHEVVLHDAWPSISPLSMLLGLGTRAVAEHAGAELAALAGMNVEAFQIGDPWVVRVRSARSTKGRALRELAAELGVERENVAFAGDWYNDLSAFAWAGRSFAMGQSPHPIRSRATDGLEKTSAEGGAIAELLARWLG